MGNVQFGGPLGVFLDPQLNVRAQPKCFGTATVAFEPQDDFANALRQSLVKQTKAQIETACRAGTSLLSLNQQPAFASAIAAASSAELGVPLEVEIQLSFGEEDMMALRKAAAEGARKNREAILAKQAAAQAPPAAPVCSRCGKPGGGKFCANCGGPMIAGAAPAPPAAPPPQNISPTNETIAPGNWLSFGAHRPLAAGSRVHVPVGFVFIGVVNWVITMNLPPGDHVLQQGCEKFAFMSTKGLPFVVKSLVRDHGKLEIRGTWYIQDPLETFKWISSIDDKFDLLEIVIGRTADRVNADNERDLCLGTAAGCLKDGDHIQGTVLVIDSMRPIA